MTLQHSTLEVRRDAVDAEVAFWALLGFERVDEPPRLEGAATWVARAGTQIHLLYEDAPSVPRRGHVAILADDYDATLARLADAGHEFRPDVELWGAARGFVRTPAGHRVEVMAAPPPP